MILTEQSKEVITDTKSNTPKTFNKLAINRFLNLRKYLYLERPNVFLQKVGKDKICFTISIQY
jgi:hypothetical protein